MGVVLEQDLELVARGHESEDLSLSPFGGGRVEQEHDDLVVLALELFDLFAHCEEHACAEVAQGFVDGDFFGEKGVPDSEDLFHGEFSGEDVVDPSVDDFVDAVVGVVEDVEDFLVFFADELSDALLNFENSFEPVCVVVLDGFCKALKAPKGV